MGIGLLRPDPTKQPKQHKELILRDSRLEKLAAVLVNYSTQVKPGQLVRIMGPPIAQPALEAVYEQVLRAGAHPLLRMTPPGFDEIFYDLANEEQLKYVSPLAVAEWEQIDATIAIRSASNTKALSGADPKKQALASAARKPISKIFMERSAAVEEPDKDPGVKPLRWVVTIFPSDAHAQDAMMSLRDYEEFFFTAGHLDKDDPVAEWRKLAESQKLVADYLNGKKEIHFTNDAGTDLTVNVEGMRWLSSAGECNFPDGEVFTGPNLKAADGGINGVVHYSFPAVHQGREINDIVLTFEGGKVVDAKASSNEDFLNEMLDQDAGARYGGEIALGTNYQITRYTKNTLFDEKIGGTFHLAVGAGYPETGNTNESGLHWDMMCDMRPGGTVTVDDEVISKDGKFVFDGWPGNG